MRIAFDVLPLIGCRMTGIGYCEAGQIQALTRLYPDDEFLLQFFSRKNEEIKIQRLQPISGKCKAPLGKGIRLCLSAGVQLSARLLSALLRR